MRRVAPDSWRPASKAPPGASNDVEEVLMNNGNKKELSTQRADEQNGIAQTIDGGGSGYSSFLAFLKTPSTAFIDMDSDCRKLEVPLAQYADEESGTTSEGDDSGGYSEFLACIDKHITAPLVQMEEGEFGLESDTDVSSDEEFDHIGIVEVTEDMMQRWAQERVNEQLSPPEHHNSAPLTQMEEAEGGMECAEEHIDDEEEAPIPHEYFCEDGINNNRDKAVEGRPEIFNDDEGPPLPLSYDDQDSVKYMEGRPETIEDEEPPMMPQPHEIKSSMAGNYDNIATIPSDYTQERSAAEKAELILRYIIWILLGIPPTVERANGIEQNLERDDDLHPSPIPERGFLRRPSAVTVLSANVDVARSLWKLP